VPVITITNRSNPSANPPCGGAPYPNAVIKCSKCPGLWHRQCKRRRGRRGGCVGGERERRDISGSKYIYRERARARERERDSRTIPAAEYPRRYASAHLYDGFESTRLHCCGTVVVPQKENMT
jgi:hypothetical protein